MVCKFNIIHYGSLLMIYPILIFTNLNSLLMIGMSCLLFPQIYHNATIGLRPKLNHVYYTKYILPRFLLIVVLLSLSSTFVHVPTTSSPLLLTTLLSSSALHSSACNLSFLNFKLLTAPKRSFLPSFSNLFLTTRVTMSLTPKYNHKKCNSVRFASLI